MTRDTEAAGARPRRLTRQRPGGVMTDTLTTPFTESGLRWRRLTRADLPRLLPLAHYAGLLAWAGDEPAAYFDAYDVSGCLAEGADGTAGFVLAACPRWGQPSPPAVLLPLVRAFYRRAGRGLQPV